MDLSGSGQRPLAGSCESSESIKNGIVLLAVRLLAIQEGFCSLS
jgi:hypothetical protein